MRLNFLTDIAMSLEMGNAHGGSGTSADSHSSGTNGIAAHYVKRKQRLAELHNLRRRSVPAEGIFVTGVRFDCRFTGCTNYS